jgi:hypothetical protein
MGLNPDLRSYGLSYDVALQMQRAYIWWVCPYSAFAGEGPKQTIPTWAVRNMKFLGATASAGIVIYYLLIILF